MHIIRVCPSYYPHFYLGGSVVADYEIDKALVAEGHTVTVLTCKGETNDIAKEALSEKHKVIRYRSIGNSKYGISLGQGLAIIREYWNKRDDVKIVWFGGVWNLWALIGPILCRILTLKYVMTTHGMLIPSLIDMKSSFLKKIVIKIFLKKHLEKAHKVHFTVKDELQKTLLATKAKMQSVIFPLCFDLSRFDCRSTSFKAEKTNKVTISFIGRITQKKRVDLIIKALEMISPKIKKNVRFNVFGPDEASLWDTTRYTKSKVGVEINYKGPVYGKELVHAYHETDIFILCSESENFAISVVEAAFCYCVPLLTKEVGVSEYFSNTSAAFSKLDAFDISRNIEDLVCNETKREELSNNARLVSEQFSTKSLEPSYFKKLIG